MLTKEKLVEFQLHIDKQSTPYPHSLGIEIERRLTESHLECLGWIQKRENMWTDSLNGLKKKIEELESAIKEAIKKECGMYCESECCKYSKDSSPSKKPIEMTDCGMMIVRKALAEFESNLTEVENV